MQRPGEFRVSVAKDYLVFASAHFITFAGHRCEGLHGHNYRARVTIEGELDQESGWVIDFIEVKRIMPSISQTALSGRRASAARGHSGRAPAA